MKRDKKDDAFDWFGALKRSTEQVRELRPTPLPAPDPCLCGSTDIRGRIITEPVDLTDADVILAINEGQRPCRACQHGITHGATCVQRYYATTTTVRDYYHPTCVRLS